MRKHGASTIPGLRNSARPGITASVHHRLRREMARDNLVGLRVHVARGGADLLIGIRRQVFHEEVQNPALPLEDAEQLQGPILISDRRWRRGRRWDFGRKSEVRDNIFRQLTAE